MDDCLVMSSCFTILYITLLVSVLQCTGPMSHGVAQPTSHQAPHSVPQQMVHPFPQPTMQQQRQEMISSTETLSQPEASPNASTFSSSTLRSASPKPDASELYLKSKAILDSKRKYKSTYTYTVYSSKLYYRCKYLFNSFMFFNVIFGLVKLTSYRCQC